jgi:antitoxin MazE
MTIHVKKWGNSASVRIPASILAAAGLKVDDPVEVRQEEGRIVIEPVREHRYDLASLLAQVTPENIHEETDFGPSVGREIW